MRIEIVRFAFLFVLLMTNGHAVDSTETASKIIRLKVPVKVVLPNAGQSGINLEVERWGYVDQTGKMVIPAEWDSVAYFHEGIACVERGNKLGFIDENGKVICEPQWDSDGIADINGTLVDGFVPIFSEGLVAVEKDKKWGYIDRTGKLVVPIQWDYARDLNEGLAAVAEKTGNSQLAWGFIDKSGKVVIKPRWPLARAC